MHCRRVRNSCRTQENAAERERERERERETDRQTDRQTTSPLYIQPHVPLVVCGTDFFLFWLRKHFITKKIQKKSRSPSPSSFIFEVRLFTSYSEGGNNYSSLFQ